MSRSLLLILVLLLCGAAPLQAAEVLFVQSARGASFDQVQQGFRKVCGASSKTLVLSDYAEVDVARIVREQQPSLIVALGDTALNSVKKIRRIPILSIMSLELSMGRKMAPNVTGVGIVAAPEQYMKLFLGMKARRVGVLYDPSHSGAYLSAARRAAEKLRVELVEQEVHDPRTIQDHLTRLKGHVDALWLLPDTTVVSPAMLDSYFLFSLEQWKPVVAFSGAYLAMGAASVLEVDRLEMGRQGAEIANRLLGGASPSMIPFQDPTGIMIKQNQSVLLKLGIKLNTE